MWSHRSSLAWSQLQVNASFIIDEIDYSRMVDSSLGTPHHIMLHVIFSGRTVRCDENQVITVSSDGI